MIKVKVCMPDPLPFDNVVSAARLWQLQGEIIEVKEAETTYKWDGFYYNRDWFKVVEETPYQKWNTPEIRFHEGSNRAEIGFAGGRASLKPLLKELLQTLEQGGPTDMLKKLIKKELER